MAYSLYHREQGKQKESMNIRVVSYWRGFAQKLDPCRRTASGGGSDAMETRGGGAD